MVSQYLTALNLQEPGFRVRPAFLLILPDSHENQPENAVQNLVNVNLQLLSTEHRNLTSILNLEAFAISQSWDDGTGRYSGA